jgi:hypothetical protein
LIVGAAIALLVLHGSFEIIRDAASERPSRAGASRLARTWRHQAAFKLGQCRCSRVRQLE